MMIVTPEMVEDAVRGFVGGDGRREGERFGQFVCRQFQICDPMIARETRDADALDLFFKRWVNSYGKRTA